MSVVLFNEYPTQDGRKIGEILLNSERSLNALQLEMIDLIQPQLDAWKDDDSIVAVVMDSVGPKAFCAGGDIVGLYHELKAGNTEELPKAFFGREYRLDFTIHTYPKPIICWGSGIVMGGGMGLMNGCSHRVVTETTMMAMPEVTIGLYPDVGGSWFLNRMPGRTGLFLGLTGSRMNAADALFLGLADRFVGSEMRSAMMERLQAADWQIEADTAVNQVLRQLEQESQALNSAQPQAESAVRNHYDFIQQVTDHDAVADIVAALVATETDDKWIQKAQKAIGHGSPLAINLIHRQWHRAVHLSLAEAFRAELELSVQCCRNGEFAEGIRALLVDKDGAPNWMFSSLEDVDQNTVNRFFEPVWEESPLADL
jgi:enoyl-CoA hydratase/carnithine racemase